MTKKIISSFKRTKTLVPILFLTLALILSLSAEDVSAAGDNIYVNDTGGNDDFDGSSWINAKKTIKNATDSVNDNGILNLANGQYTGIDNTEITINKNITINGESQEKSIINGTGANWIFIINSGMTLTLNNLTITQASRSGNGGAIYNVNGNLTANNCNFTANTATGDYGGAIYNTGTANISNSIFTKNTISKFGGAIDNVGNLTITYSTFANNNAAIEGGAIYNHGAGTVTITDSTFTGNTGQGNVAICNHNGAITVTGSNFTNNTGTDGGAIANCGTFKLIDCTFTKNTALNGGAGVIINNGALNVTNSSFTDNFAGYWGGAISNMGNSNLIVTECTFTNNTAQDISMGGGAICNENSYSTATITNSSFINNTATNGPGGAIYNNGILNVSGSVFINNTAPNNNGGAIYNYKTLNMDFCQIIENTPNDIQSDSGSCIVNCNWWGTNFKDTDPVNAGRVLGATVSKWLVLTITTNPSIINKGNISTIIADLWHDQNGVYYSPLDRHVPDAIPVTFTTDLGSVGSKTVNKETINGAATAILTADETIGIAHVNVLMDSQIVNTDVSIKLNTLTTAENKKNFSGQNILLNATIKDEDGLNVSEGQVRFTVNGINAGTANVVNGIATLNWQIPSTWTAGTYEIVSQFLATGTYLNSQNKANLTVDTKPTAWANIKGGLFNVNKNVYLYMNKVGTRYYTINGSTPTKASTKYTGYLTITYTTTLKFIAVDSEGNVSPVYTEKYVIDKTTPKVSYTYPKNLRTGQSRTANLYLKFSENIKTSSYWSSIYVKDLKTGKKVSITKWIKGNTLYIKTRYTRASYRWYQVYIPYKAVKDYAGNNLAKTYTYKFKTRG